MLPATAKHKPLGARLKHAIFVLHLWLGLACGVLFSLVCASGCFLALHPQLEAWSNREMLKRQVGPARAPLATTVTAALAASPLPPRELEIPAEPDQALRLRLDGKGSLYLDPFTGRALGELNPFLGDSYETVEHLHRWLLLDSKVGRPITGAAALVYLSLMLSGLFLWLSKCLRNPSRGLAFRRGVGWKRLAYDAHLILGIYALVPLFLMASTGLYWSYREPYKAIVYRVLDGTGAPPAPPKDKDKDGPRRLDLAFETILQCIDREDPRPGLVKIAFPKLGGDEVKVTKTRVAGFWRLPTRDEWIFDANTGKIVERRTFSTKTRAEKFLSLVFDIHSGAAWGNVTLVLWIIAVLFGLTLPISGTVMWANRMRGQWRARQKRDRRQTDSHKAAPADSMLQDL